MKYLPGLPNAFAPERVVPDAKWEAEFREDLCEAMTQMKEEDYAFSVAPDWDVYRIVLRGKLSMVVIRLRDKGTPDASVEVGFIRPGVNHTAAEISAYLYDKQ